MKQSEDIAAGDLTCSIAFYAPSYNEGGDEITGETLLFAGVAAAKRAMQGREVRDAGRDTSEQWVVWTIRYRAGIDTAKRLTHAGTDYDIEAIDDPTGSKRRLDITTKVVK